MTIHRSTFRRFALSTMLLAVPLDAALAQDAAAVADRLKAGLAGQGVDISWTEVTGDASSMVLKGVTVKPAAEQEGLAIGNVTLTGITEKDGGYVVGTLTTAPFSKTEDGLTVDVSPLVISGMNVPGDGATDPLASIMLYESVELASMTVKMADKTAFAHGRLGFRDRPRPPTASRCSSPARPKNSAAT